MTCSNIFLPAKSRIVIHWKLKASSCILASQLISSKVEQDMVAMPFGIFYIAGEMTTLSVSTTLHGFIRKYQALNID